MKLYEVSLQQKGFLVGTKKGGPKKPAFKAKSHLVVSSTGPLARKKVQDEFGPDYKVGKANMIFDFNPK